MEEEKKYVDFSGINPLTYKTDEQKKLKFMRTLKEQMYYYIPKTETQLFEIFFTLGENYFKNPEKQKEYNERGGYNFDLSSGLKLLMQVDDVLINNRWWEEKELGEQAHNLFYIGIVANDFFTLCCADAVEVAPFDLEEILLYYLIDPVYGINIWMCKKEQQRPTKKFEDCLKYSKLPVKDILPFLFSNA